MSDASIDMSQWYNFFTSLTGESQIFVIGPLLNQRVNMMGPTIFVDGGLMFRDRMSDRDKFPSLSVGDGDSCGDLKMDLKLPVDKDYSDLAFVLRNMPPSIRHVELLGFLGGRRDHEIINLGEVQMFLNRVTELTTVRFDDMITAFCGANVSVDLRGEFSVVVFESTMLTVTGACKYEVPRPAMLAPFSSLGLSNEGFGEVVFDSLKPCFVFQG